jgi:hypothetical protein
MGTIRIRNAEELSEFISAMDNDALYEIVHAIAELWLVEDDESGLVTDHKELGADAIGQVSNILSDYGICPSN